MLGKGGISVSQTSIFHMCDPFDYLTFDHKCYIANFSEDITFFRRYDLFNVEKQVNFQGQGY